MNRQRTIKEITSITSVVFDANDLFPELYPDYTYGTTIDIDIIKFKQDNQLSPTYIEVGGKLFTVDSVKALLKEIEDFDDLFAHYAI